MPVFLSLFLLQSGGIRLDEGGGPKLPDKDEQIELAVVVFEVEIGTDGSVIGNDLIQGRPEYVERSRLAIKDWRFTGIDPKSAPIRASVVFLYRPRHEFPDDGLIFDQPLPDAFDEEHRSPFPVTVVDPGYPLDAFGEIRKKVAIKCDLCAGYNNQACVQACPTGAAFRAQPAQFFGSTEEILQRRAQ